MNNSFSTATPKQHHQGMKEMSKVLPIAIAIILTNGLVFFMFYKRKSLCNSSNYLLLGLAVCDFLTGAVSIPYYLIFSFQVVPPSMTDDFAYWMVILQTLVAVSAAYHILVITGEKYLAIIKPLKHHLVTKTMVFKVLVGIWVVSGFIAAVPFAWRESQTHFWSVIHAVICLVIVFLVPYIFMVYAYTAMFKAVSGRNRPSQHGSNKRRQKRKSNDRKCIIVFAVMAAVYLCCWLPYFALMLTYKIKEFTNSKDFAVVDKYTEPFVIIRFITSVTNPLLYTFFKRDIWFALRSLSLKRKVSFAVVPKRSTTIRSFSIGYFSSRSSDSSRSRSADRGSPNKQLITDNVKMNVEYIVFVSSV